MTDKYIYLDYNSTTPLDERVHSTMIPYFRELFANESSSHLFGLSVKEAIEESSESLALSLGAKSQNIIYTSGATEAINLVIKGVASSDKKHIVTVATEHHAVLDVCGFLENFGYQVTYLPVDSLGIIDLAQLADVVTDRTLLVCVMLANNETGTIQPIKKVSKIAHEHGALMLCDATQAIGRIAVDVQDLGVDFAAISAHKFYGPKGTGALYVSDDAKKYLTAQIHGGGQQNGFRSGTLNVPGIIGMSAAMRLAEAEMALDCSRIKKLRDLLETELLGIADTVINGDVRNRLCNTTNICFRGVSSEKLIINLNTISVSSGSACSATISRPSHVLKAMGLSDADGLSALRFSLGRFTTEDDIFKTIEAINHVIPKLRTFG